MFGMPSCFAMSRVACFLPVLLALVSIWSRSECAVLYSSVWLLSSELASSWTVIGGLVFPFGVFFFFFFKDEGFFFFVLFALGVFTATISASSEDVASGEGEGEEEEGERFRFFFFFFFLVDVGCFCCCVMVVIVEINSACCLRCRFFARRA